MEGPSGLLRALRGVIDRRTAWNRSHGELWLPNGTRVFCDGADDGAYRIQGKNLRGAWCDEVGLWKHQWDVAWNHSLQFAVRLEPARIVATGTPKMGNPLVGQLLGDPRIPSTRMRTIDNIDNLHDVAVQDLLKRWQGTRLGQQELEGEYLAEVEGDVLRRDWWQAYPLAWLEHWEGPAPTSLVSSWDTSMKEKTSSDYTVGTLWVQAGPNYYLVRVFREICGLTDTIRAVQDQVAWGSERFPNLPCQVLVENRANGPEVIARLRSQIPGILPVNPSVDKRTRAMAASVLLESGNLYVPGVKRGDGSLDLTTSETPAWVAAFVDELALFRGDGNDAHDDQVDSFSMAMGRRVSRIDWRPEDRPVRREPAVMAGAVGKQF